MGRKSRRHTSHPGHRCPTRGDVQRTDGRLLERAAEACGDVLMTDLRILELHYPAWLAAHDLPRLEQAVQAATRRWWRPGSIPVVLAAEFGAAVWGGPLDGEIETLETALREMGVPWAWVSPWLLTNNFPVCYANTFGRTVGAKPLKMVGEAEMVATATKGRQPTAEALASLQRQASYWYRREVKDPPDALEELEKYERARTGETWASSRHSTVIQGISRFKSLCGVWERSELGLSSVR